MDDFIDPVVFKTGDCGRCEHSCYCQFVSSNRDGIQTVSYDLSKAIVVKHYHEYEDLCEYGYTPVLMKDYFKLLEDEYYNQNSYSPVKPDRSLIFCEV